MRIHEAVTHSYGARGDRGAVSFILTMFVGFLIFVSIGALAMDLSATANRAQELQSASDAAALAAVVAYEDTLIATGDVGAAQTAASDLAKLVLTQNGIDLTDTNLVPTITSGNGRVNVRIRDNTVTSVLSPIAGSVFGFDHGVEREATAEFLGCDACELELDIPEPPKPVNVEGDGDGYKPIEVGDRLYALNHNSHGRQIVCIDTKSSEPCWPIAPPVFEDSRDAYAPGMMSGLPGPEMPLTGVVDDKIYWSASDSAGHWLFCYDTDDDPLFDAPCPSAVQLGNQPRGDDATMPNIWVGEGGGDGNKDENRGGGTVEWDDRIYVFTDNHEIHCFDPAANTYCAGFIARPYGGMPTALDVFPDADPLDGNHGSSIDRIVDEDEGYIYSTIHIPTAVDSHDCSALTSESNVDDLVDQVVVIENAGVFLSAVAIDDVEMTGDATDPVAQWRVTRDLGDTFVYLESVEVEEWLDGDDFSAVPTALNTDSNRVETDNQWLLAPIPGGGFTIESVGAATSFVNYSPPDPEQGIAPATVWNISTCADDARDAGYAPGTWVHCYNTGVDGTGAVTPPGPCPGFTPTAPLHTDAHRYSGRLFFNYDAAPPGGTANKSAICSSGYRDFYAVGVPNTIEINCLSLLDGSPVTSPFDALRDKIQALTGDAPRAWGDPHYNEFQNRMFYPTQHSAAWNLCWDFNAAPAGLCGPEFRGSRPPTAADPSPYTEDYGYISKDNCVFALGHTAYFWAFEADNIGEPCKGATSKSVIDRCGCTGGASRWGTLDFSELDLTLFDVFRFRLLNDPADPDDEEIIWPGDSSMLDKDRWHELKPGSGIPKIGLDGILNPDPNVPYPDSTIQIEFYIEADPSAFSGSIDPRGRIRFELRPHLIE